MEVDEVDDSNGPFTSVFFENHRESSIENDLEEDEDIFDNQSESYE